MNILTFGEPLLINYLTTPKIVSNCDSFFSLGGSEINTAVTLSNLGNQVYLLSVFPNNDLGNEFIEVIENLGINIKYVIKSEDDLIGSMYVKDNYVIYQRKHSAFSYIKNINLEDLFLTNYNWVHLTGITPSLNDNCKKQWVMLLEKSLSLNLPVSIDFNYRPALCQLNYLWNIIKPYISRLELFALSEKDLKDICKLEHINIGECSLDKIMKLSCKFLGIKRMVICVKKLLLDGSQDRYSIMIYNNEIYKSEIKNHVPIEHIGGGDAYIGGLINGILKCNSNILDDADNFAIECQNSRGNFI